MRQSIKMLICAMAGAVLLPSAALAVGTPAGSSIKNKATITYGVGSATGFTKESNEIESIVDEILEVDVTVQTPTVQVFSGDNNRVLTFRVTNDGNGTDSYLLTVDSTLSGNDDFDPTFTSIYIDHPTAGVVGSLDTANDTLYTTGAAISIPADGFITVHVLNNIQSGLVDEDRGDSQLTATSKTVADSSFTPDGGNVGESIAGAGDSINSGPAGDAVIGNADGADKDLGTYVISGIVVLANKTVIVVSDPINGTTDPKKIPGAVLRYRVEVNVSGSGTAKAAKFTDPIPTHTTYLPGTLKLDSGAGLQVITDNQIGDVGVTTANTVTVTLGDLTSASPTHSVEFDVVIVNTAP